jgi:hypothetical protein
MVDTTGEQDLRAEDFESIVKGFALQEFKIKPLLMNQTSNAWIETYYRETATELTGGLGSAVKGIPRLAAFPYGEPSWTKVQAYIEKYGMEGIVSWEDMLTDNIDVVARTLLRISRAVAYAVDSQIYAVMLVAAAVGGGGSTVTVAAGSEWNSATVANRDPIANILSAKNYLYTNNFDPDRGEGFILLNPNEYEYLLGNSKVVNNPSFKTADVVSNGVVGVVCGLKIIVSNVVTTDTGTIVGIAKECGTWKSASPLTVHTIEDKGVKYTIRAYEMGVTQITTPKALVLITNTKA